MVHDAASPERIIDGFLESGMLDRSGHSCPDFNGILRTCQRNITTEEHNLAKDEFERLYEFQNIHGHIPDVMYDDLGFTQDFDINGEIVARDANIAQEYLQRAKCLSDEFQISLREARKQQIIIKEQEKHDSSVQKKRSMLELNSDAETTLLTAMGTAQAPEIIGFPTAELVHFDELNKQQLKAFIHVREFNSATAPHGFGMSTLNKSTVRACANPTHDCLLRRAYDRRVKPIILTIDPHEINNNNAEAIMHNVEEMHDDAADMLEGVNDE